MQVCGERQPHDSTDNYFIGEFYYSVLSVLEDE